MTDDEINPLGTPTTNYGWIKPTVGGDDDAWGGLLNTDLDGIDSTVKSVSTVANAAYPASNPAGYITASAIPAPYVLPTASTTILGGVKVDGSTVTIAGGTISSSGGAAPSSTPPLMDGIVAVGTGTTFARADHVHPTDTHSMGDNRIINGDMRIDQRNNGASGTATGYTVDRWAYYSSVAGLLTWGRLSPSAYGLSFGLGYSLNFTSLSAHTVGSSDNVQLYQAVEADMVTDFAWGTASAKSVTLSFWVNSSLTGTFSGAISGASPNRTYPFSYSVPAANTWTKIVVTIPGDTGGTWTMSGNAAAIIVQFDLGCGSSSRGPANAWASAGYIGVTGSVSVVATNAATFALTGVKLEIGSVATPFNRQSLAKSMADCQRYYCDLANGSSSPAYQVGGSYGAAAAYTGPLIYLPVPMRAAPTATLRDFTASGVLGFTLSVVSKQTITSVATTTGSGNQYATFNLTASAEL